MEVRGNFGREIKKKSALQEENWFQRFFSPCERDREIELTDSFLHDNDTDDDYDYDNGNLDNGNLEFTLSELFKNLIVQVKEGYRNQS